MARSWSIPSEDPYEEAARQLLEQAPHSPEYVPEDHVPVYILEPKHPEDLVPAEDEAPIPLLPPSFLSLRIRPFSPRALEVEMRRCSIRPTTFFPPTPSGTHHITYPPLPAPSTVDRGLIFPGVTRHLRIESTTYYSDLGEDYEQALELVIRRVHLTGDVCIKRGFRVLHTTFYDALEGSELLRAERLRSELSGLLEARVTVLETEVCHHEWQRQAADDLVVQYIMRTQALEAGARIDTLEDTGHNLKALNLTKELVACAMAEAEAAGLGMATIAMFSGT
ncbi:hypothetical protein Tco_0842629 [Tanacetum coccineum]|uniref:Band 7 domain-containing protein n=1 Tax=Tanacetum coccineum TaxID=301880 RepID=A0ABQ5B2I0_9ASTR